MVMAMATDATETPLVRVLQPKEEDDDTPKYDITHMRTCNKRKVCSCYLRAESRTFQNKLAQKIKRVRRKMPAVGMTRVKRLEEFTLGVKSVIASFLDSVSLARLSMTNRSWHEDVEALAERDAHEFVKEESREGIVITTKKHEDQTWSRYRHLQFNSVHKLFVYYTAYKTGEMRKQTPFWAFGEILVDPNEPSRAIMPNSWSFEGYNPWVQRKSNGKCGEWTLTRQFQFDKAPKPFVRKVNEWVATLRPGSFLAASFQHEGSTELTWWEAQIWYMWKGDGREDPAIVYDPINNLELEVHPKVLVQHFRENPEHVIDVGSTPRSVCKLCVKKNLNFYTCHVVKGHPML